MNVTRRLLTSELRLLLREPLVLAFVFAFPVITVLVLGGVFDDDDPAFEGVLPSDFYIAAYFGVVIAAVGLIMLPVHIASYREAGVLRRFDAAGFPRWAFPVSQFVIGAVFVAIGAVLLLATAALAYGLPGSRGRRRERLPASSPARWRSSASACCSARCSRTRGRHRASGCCSSSRCSCWREAGRPPTRCRQ